MTKQRASEKLAQAALNSAGEFDESLLSDAAFVALLQKVKARLDAEGLEYFSRI